MDDRSNRQHRVSAGAGQYVVDRLGGLVMLTCKDCDKRHPGCHDNCCTYQAALAERIARNQWLHRCGLQTSRGWYKGPYGYKRVKGGDH